MQNHYMDLDLVSQIVKNNYENHDLIVSEKHLLQIASLILTSGDPGVNYRGSYKIRISECFNTLLFLVKRFHKDIPGHLPVSEYNKRLLAATALTFCESSGRNGTKFKEGNVSYNLDGNITYFAHFNKPVKCESVYEILQNPCYPDYSKDSGVNFLEKFMNLNTWQLRFVVGSWCESTELIWARDNLPESFKLGQKCMSKITYDLLKYTDHNCNGVNIHKNEKEFYHNKPRTLKNLSETGGVCGAVSKFNVGMCQAHGIPSAPVGQPGHCAFITLVDGCWKLTNGCSGWDKTRRHLNCACPWSDGCNSTEKSGERMRDFCVWKMNVMELAQKDQQIFVVSEEARYQNDYKLSVEMSPFNFHSWRELFSKSSADNIRCAKTKTTRFLNNSDLTFINATQSDHNLDVANLFDGSKSEWMSCANKNNISVGFNKPYHADSIRLQWWGISEAKTYTLKLLFSGAESACLKKIDADSYGNNGAYNSWTTFKLNKNAPKLTGLELSLENGTLDPWNKGVHIGMRNIEVKVSETEIGIKAFYHDVLDKALVDVVLKEDAKRCLDLLKTELFGPLE